MSNVTKKKLGELVEIDNNQLTSLTDPNFLFTYIDIGSVEPQRINISSDSIQFRNAPLRARKVIRDGDILMSTVRPNLKAFARFHSSIKDRNYVASTGFAVLREKEGADIEYVYQYLFSNSIEKQIESMVVGSNYPSINTKDIRNLSIVAPDLPIQRKIALILSTVDRQIEKTEQLIHKYKMLKTGMIEDLFTRGINIKTGKLRPTYLDEPELYKESELGYIPKEWEVKTLKDYIVGYTSGWSPVCHDEPAQSGEWGSLKTSSITFDGFDPNENKRIPMNLQIKYSCEARNNDVLITRVGPRSRVGIAALVLAQINKLLLSENMLRIDLAVALPVSREFIVSWFNCSRNQIVWQNRIAGLAEAQVVINQGTISKTLFVVPTTKEQELINQCIVSISDNILKTTNYSKQLTNLKQGLVQDLLSGKILAPG